MTTYRLDFLQVRSLLLVLLLLPSLLFAQDVDVMDDEVTGATTLDPWRRLALHDAIRLRQLIRWQATISPTLDMLQRDVDAQRERLRVFETQAAAARQYGFNRNAVGYTATRWTFESQPSAYQGVAARFRRFDMLPGEIYKPPPPHVQVFHARIAFPD